MGPQKVLWTYSKPFGLVQNHFGTIEGQSKSQYWSFERAKKSWSVPFTKVGH